jgi:hypothetical protein
MMRSAVSVLDGKGFKAAIADGGWLGPIKRSVTGTFNGTVVHHIGDDWPWRAGQAVFMLYEFQDHVGVSIRQSMFKFSTLVIPKSDVLHWGVLERRSIPVAMPSDRSSTIAGLLLYGPIGALVGASMDASADKRMGDKPVIGVTYRGDLAEHAIFMDFQLSAWYHKAHDFLDACLPGLLRD